MRLFNGVELDEGMHKSAPLIKLMINSSNNNSNYITDEEKILVVNAVGYNGGDTG